MMDDNVLEPDGPPNSPPISYTKNTISIRYKFEIKGSLTTRRRIKMKKQVRDVIKKRMTEKTKAPGGVTHFSPLLL